MNQAALEGHLILVLEDEPLVALEIMDSMRRAGASVLGARCVREAMTLAEHPDLSAAILDFGLKDGDASSICDRLTARRIPFVLYSGYPQVDDACHKGIQVPKPARPAELVATVVGMLH